MGSTIQQIELLHLGDERLFADKLDAIVECYRIVFGGG